MNNPIIENNYLVERNAHGGERLISASHLRKGKKTGKKSRSSARVGDVLGKARAPTIAEEANVQLGDPLSHPDVAPTANSGAPAEAGDGSPLLPAPGLAYFIAKILNEANDIYSQLELADNSIEQHQLEYYDAQANIYAKQEKTFYYAQRSAAVAGFVGMMVMGGVTLGALGYGAIKARGLGVIPGLDGGESAEMKGLEAKRNSLQALDPLAEVDIDRVDAATTETEGAAGIGTTPEEAEDAALKKIRTDLESKNAAYKDAATDLGKFNDHATEVRQFWRAMQEGDDPEGILSEDNTLLKYDPDTHNLSGPLAEEVPEYDSPRELNEELGARRKAKEMAFDKAKTDVESAKENRDEELDNVKKEIEKLRTKAQERAGQMQSIGAIGQAMGQVVQNGANIQYFAVQGIASAERAKADRKRTDGQMGLQAGQGLFSGAQQALEAIANDGRTALNAAFQAQRA